jgi:NAD+ synthase
MATGRDRGTWHSARFDVDAERDRRVAFVGDYLASQGLRTYMLRVSGGVDSSTAGRLEQRAVDRLRACGYEARL